MDQKTEEGGHEANACPGYSVSKRDLKLLSLVFIGDTDGVYYFRNPADQTRTYTGDRSDYAEWRDVRQRHSMIDPATARAVLQTRENAAAVIEA